VERAAEHGVNERDWKSAIVRILAADGRTAGTGFLVASEGVIITCAHVVAHAGPEGTVSLVFRGDDAPRQARVAPECWRPADEEDVAVLRLEGAPPEGVEPLPIGGSRRLEGRSLYTFGYPTGRETEGLPGEAVVIGDTTVNGHRVIALRSSEVTTGFSGAPAWDAELRCAVGMVTAIQGADAYGRMAATAFATPGETLRESCVGVDVPGPADVVRERWSRWTRSQHALNFAPALGEPLDLVRSPLWSEWDDFVTAAAWHERMESQFTQVAEQAGRFPELSWLEAAVGEIDWVERLLTDPERHPGFERCFLVLGSPGSGKTHFVASLLEESARAARPWRMDDLVLFLPLAHAPGGEGVESRMLEGVRQASGIEWTDLAELDRFLKEEANGTRLVVVIDDLQKWLAERPAVLEELTGLIATLTSLHSLYWLLTLEFTAYPAVAGHGAFWVRYGMRNDTGWAMLDVINDEEQVGIGILRAAWGAAAEETDWLDDRASASPYLNVPFVARIALALGLGPAELVNLNFTDFVEAFWKVRSAFDYALHTSTMSAGRAQDVVDSVLATLLEILAEGRDTSPRVGALLDAVVRNDPEISAAEAGAALDILNGAGLIRLEREGGSTGAIVRRATRRVVVLYEMFWEYNVAVQLQEGSATLIDAGATRQELERWFSGVTSPSLRDGVFTFLLLLADRDGMQPSWAEAVRALIDSALTSDHPPASAVWFAGPRASEALQRRIAELAPRYALGGGTRRSLFAFAYFVSESRPEVLALDARLALLRPHYAALQENSLAQYFVFTIRRMFGRELENRPILESLPHLSGCEVLGVTERLAQLTATVLLENAELGVDRSSAHDETRSGQAAAWERARAFLEMLASYLAACTPRVEAEYAWLGQGRPRERRLFRESLLHHLLRGLAARFEVDTFDLLVEARWYAPDRGRIHGRVAGEMRRQANITMGNLFLRMSEEERPRFVALVERLIETGAAREREIAFYLIRHTRITEGRIAVHVDRRFHPLLRVLGEDRRLRGLVARYGEMFQVNRPAP
jgi:hypothetical protein